MRPDLHKPFSRGQYTYATNGHIVVRVSRIADVAEQEKHDLSGLFNLNFKDEPRGVLEVKIPVIKDDWCDCRVCDGRGTEHDCPDCSCQCDSCNGEGRENKAPTAKITIGDAVYNAKHIQQILELLGLRFPLYPPKDTASWFVFDGGEGLLMPMRWDGETDATAKIVIP